MRADWHRLNFILHWSAIMLMTEQKTLGTMTKTPYSQHLKYDFKNTTGNKCVTTSNSKRCLEKYYWWQNFKPLSLEPNLNFSQGASVSLPLIINKDGMTGVAFMFWLFFFFFLSSCGIQRESWVQSPKSSFPFSLCSHVEVTVVTKHTWINATVEMSIPILRVSAGFTGMS